MPAADRPRIIAHVDMDAFYVEAELLNKPELRGRKIIVAGEGRSVVLSASYEARADGVRSAMPLSRALQLSPHATVLPPQMHRYRELSVGIMAYFDTITDTKEQLSVDEAFLDLTGARRRLGQPQQIGERIRADIRTQFGLPATVGIADRKFIAKIASTRAKPDGLLLVPPAQRLRFLHSLKVEALWGVGDKTAQALHAQGIHTVEQLAQTPRESLKRRFGVTGEHLHDLAWGNDPREVVPQREEKSIGAEETFARDIDSDAELTRELLRLGHRVAARLRQAQLNARGVSLKLRYQDFSTLTRSATLEHPTQSAQVLTQTAVRLLQGLGERPQPVRLIGLRAERLQREDGALQLSFDTRAAEWLDAERAIDAVAQRFPDLPVAPASLLPREARRQAGGGPKLEDD
ncbi:DNA polymerase IV [Nesterenkonia massiliensis]|uniref:DNA polymerase IV n=1 Tax=Nesterenkonia massiliensis TaxID=1232429 RepID=A0ABT2HQH6_9MICC|nr:DNA polymerase IV [Nesterenkonia massiliensis]MCT1606942.1 DNA polymerase IV [Nesterenkonia massiliensis]